MLVAMIEISFRITSKGLECSSTSRHQQSTKKRITILVFTYLDSIEGAKLLELRTPLFFEAYGVLASCPVKTFCLLVQAPKQRLPWT